MTKPYTKPPVIDTALKDLLLRAVPSNPEGNKTITHLAELIPCRRSAVHLWLSNDAVPARRVDRVLEIAAMPDPRDPESPLPRITFEELRPYVGWS